MYNDDTLCSAIKPPLSSVAVALWQAGYEAAELLNDIILGKKRMAGQPILARATHVVTRQSSDILAIDDRQIASALHYIRTHLDMPIRVVDVVQATSLSRRTLEKRFRDVLRRSMVDEIQRLRVEHIADLLLETDLSIDRITANTAFESTSHMIRTFKKHKGVPPLAFRKMNARV
jgi:LacI family transcriptional regulator